MADRLAQFPAVALLGPRQVGKTTLAYAVAEGRPSIYLDLESAADRAKLSDAALFLAGHEDELVILDEVQRVPQLFQVLRGIIDAGRRRGRGTARFLLLGSASGELLSQSGESLAGRIAYVELCPLDPLEVGRDQCTTLWVRGGFPIASWQAPIAIAPSGEKISCGPTSSAISRSSAHACPRRPCGASGPCWRTRRLGFSTLQPWRGGWPWMARRSLVISI